MTREDFANELTRMFEEAVANGNRSLVVTSGGLHRKRRGYPGTNHRMAVCCSVMHSEMVEELDTVLHSPPSGQGATLRIEYFLPRPLDIS